MALSTVVFTDRTNQRGQPHKNLILCPSGSLLEFTGQNIPPNIRIVEASYGHDWMPYTVWTVELGEGYRAFVFTQDWYKSVYFTAVTWSEALAQFRTKLERNYESPRLPPIPRYAEKPDLTDAQIVQCIRFVFPEYAKVFDQSEADFIEALREDQRTLEQLLFAQSFGWHVPILPASNEGKTLVQREHTLNENRIINLTAQPATPEQIAAGVEDMPEDFRDVLLPLLEFTAPPSKDELHQRALRIRGLLSSYLRGGITSQRDNHLRGASVLIGGFPALMTQLEVALRHAGAHVCYTFSEGEPDSGDARFTWVG